jgi:hypothetical protein
MKRIGLCIIFSVLFLSVFGQPKVPTAEELTKKNVDEMVSRLKLSSTQKSVIYNYAYNFAKAQVELMKKQQSGGYGEEDIAKMYRLNNETNLNIKSVLKPEQVTEFNQLIEERLNGDNVKKKKKKKRKGEEDEEVVGIEGLKSVKGVRP